MAGGPVAAGLVRVVDEATVVAIRSERRVWQAVGAWLAGFRWQGYCILSFARRPSPESVQKAIATWFAALEEHYPRAFVFVSADRGAVSEHWNVHVLLGGLFVGRPPPEPHRMLAVRRALEVAARLWSARRGRAVKAEPYDGRRGGAVSYMTQPAYWAEPEVPATILGRPIRRAKRRRGSSGPKL